MNSDPVSARAAFQAAQTNHAKEKKAIPKELPSPASLASQKQRSAPRDLPFAVLPTPAFLCDQRLLEDNARYLAELQACLGIRILLAQKAFSQFYSYPMLGNYLCGTTASGLYEARLGASEMPGKEVHCFCPGYKKGELRELYEICDHLIFNSLNQVLLYREFLTENADLDPARAPSLGLRLNPEFSTASTELYDPAAPGSRLGVRAAELARRLAEGFDLNSAALEPRARIEGFHIHALCEQNSDAFAALAEESVVRFFPYFQEARWLNFGGGHHFCRADYDVPLFARTVCALHTLFPQATLYFEPGEAVVLDCGWLVTEVQDLFENREKLAILDASAECHCPDILEMPYRPRAFLFEDKITSAAAPAKDAADNNRTGMPEEETRASGDAAQDESFPLALENGDHLYRLGGPSCLAGDYFGRYAFARPLQVQDRIVFCDMALYSFVKSNHFNGCVHPDLYAFDERGLHLIRHFDYEDFKRHMG